MAKGYTGKLPDRNGKDQRRREGGGGTSAQPVYSPSATTSSQPPGSAFRQRQAAQQQVAMPPAAPPAAPAAAPPAPGGVVSQDPMSIWQAIQADYDEGLPQQMRLAEMEGSRQMRRAAEMGAQASGGGIGGMWQAGQAQAGLGARGLQMEAAQQHQQRGLETKMAWLEMMIERAEAENNRDLARQLQNQRDETALTIQRYNAMANSPVNFLPEAYG